MATEQSPSIPPKQEGGPERKTVSSEILDFNKYGAVYGRFLLASQAQTAEEVANILNPEKTVEFNLPSDTLKDRNYNPIAEKFSLAERKEEWKGIEYSEAYSQWRTEFTDFMVNIQDPQRERALRAILSNKKDAKEFTVNDADRLFNEFCKDKSDITHFIERITTNLVSGRKINPTYLQELLPHLEWISSGLFGKNTASQAVTRLIELESAIRNKPVQVLDTINSNKNRVNTPTDDEKKTLGLFHDSLRVPQEERIPTQVDVTLPKVPPAVPTSAPTAESPPAAPVAPQVAEPIAEKPPIIVLDGQDISVGTIKDKLGEIKTAHHATLSFSVDALKDYFISFAKSQKAKVKEGIKIEVMKDDKIAVRGIEITKSKMLVMGKINLDLILSNGPSGIIVEAQNYRANTAASMFGGDIKAKIGEIDAFFKEALKRELSKDNSNNSWQPIKLSIKGDKVLIELERSKVAS